MWGGGFLLYNYMFNFISPHKLGNFYRFAEALILAFVGPVVLIFFLSKQKTSLNIIYKYLYYVSFWNSAGIVRIIASLCGKLIVLLSQGDSSHLHH